MIYVLIGFILLYSIILHELAHAKIADMMGDGTSRMYGRLTLNPLPHLDLFGTLLPIMLLLSGSPIVFGWAKPVPINPYNFYDQRKGIIYVSAAGIAANLLVAWLLSVAVRFIPINDSPTMYLLAQALIFGVRINIVLAVFNLLPIPPLDGSKLFSMLLPYRYSQYIDRMEPFGFVILLFILIFPPTQMLLWGIINFIFNLFMLRIF